MYEAEFQKSTDTVIDFEVFAEAPLGSESAKALEKALEPLYETQKRRYKQLVLKCEGIIAHHEKELADLQATPLPPNWKIRKKSDLPAGMARAIFESDNENRSRSQWAKLLGISATGVGDVLDRAGIKRTPNIKTVKATSKRDLLSKARKDKARIMSVETDDGKQRFDAAMEIKGEVTATLQPPAEHEIISDQQPEVQPTPAKPQLSTETAIRNERADNMEKPGNWHKASWDPQFRYWELVKICQIKHGYEVKTTPASTIQTQERSGPTHASMTW